ncbi:hydrogenase iron-sulfur subunit [Thermodesulfobacterium hveragerdense]|uniref:hydrogenase iron-sulfur subunit n=1 Tax=Thermodesulfobacterium hveragerdense TaxID=53424 RepID=UPI00041BD80D|nr:hydrogenase iron-sulfur subunit [Thermodesulfobacterium hveragerdense]
MEKIGVFICSSCNIGDRLELADLENAAKDQGAAVVYTKEFLCSKEGKAFIEEKIAQDGLDSVSICACSQRVNYEVFSFDQVAVDRVSLREGVVWSRFFVGENGEILEDTAEYVSGVTFKDELMALAKDYVRMSVAKLQTYKKPEPFKPEEEISKVILVIGGGVAGLTATLEAAKAGYEVVLVEKEKELGGFVAKMKAHCEVNPPFQKLVPPVVKDLIAQVEANDKIKVYKGAVVTNIAGAPGLFQVKIKQGGKEEEIKIGSIVLAAGFKPYDASKLADLGYGVIPNVVTNVKFEEMAKNGALVRPSDGAPVKSVLFIQCAGQRDENHLSYCSGFCCLASLKQAQYVREADPEAKAFIVYDHMRTMGIFENFYKTLQNDPGVFLTKGKVFSITEGENGKVKVLVDETLLGEKIEVEVDLVVLAIGMVPVTAEEPVLNLEYRQGLGLPELELFYGYADSNFICFPYETRRTGIYAAGAIHQPMTIQQAIEDAKGAALKAIQCLVAIEEGHAVHPRTWDYAYPEWDLKMCTQCKRCTEECPFGALNEDEKGNPLTNITRCRRCGTCFGACPQRIINFKDYSIDMVSTMIKATEMPEQGYEQYRLMAFVCENDALPALDMVAYNKKSLPVAFRIIPVRCLGAVNVAFIKDSMSKGYDGILLLGCKYGENYQCHFIKGSELANRRMENVAETLQQLALESERVTIHTVAIDEVDLVVDKMQKFAEEIKGFGENPFKGW